MEQFYIVQSQNDFSMQNLLKSEEALLSVVGLFLLSYFQMPFHWAWYILLFFAPDIGMLGYLFGPEIGGICYNVFHHKGLFASIAAIGLFVGSPMLCVFGILFFSHAAFDRILGYGLKYLSGFKHTHLGDL
jgi:hypothetical protein